MKSSLYIVSVPIGNDSDISARAVEILRKSDLLIGEEFRNTAAFLKRNGVSKEFELLNEHSTFEDTEVLFRKIQSSEITSLFSDAGTPVIADPGRDLISRCADAGIQIKSVPGPSSVTAALSISGLNVFPFTCAGFVSREDSARREEIRRFLKLNHTLIFLETPYRYKKLFHEIDSLLKTDPRCFLGLGLTSEEEIQFRGKWSELRKEIDRYPKLPPVLILELL
ncbi:MAG TPA: SAM-dependent methyltransferase [Leptospiraceae bacterium]|nr:SAM-dependent methyltransferase [Leptospiraceae bacterium]HNI96352.1 SAM-dependent methyltransferase [Leptospiraceae bacterium]